MAIDPERLKFLLSAPMQDINAQARGQADFVPTSPSPIAPPAPMQAAPTPPVAPPPSIVPAFIQPLAPPGQAVKAAAPAQDLADPYQAPQAPQVIRPPSVVMAPAVDQRVMAKVSEKGYLSSLGHAQQAGEAKLEAKGIERDAIAQGAAQELQALQEAEARARESEDRRQRMMGSMIDSQERMAADVADTKINPKQYWADKSTGDRIVLGIAQALGSLAGAARGDGRNNVSAMIDKEVDRDISAQRDNLANKRASLSEANSLYAKRLQMFGDEKAAEAAAKADALTIVQAKVKNLATKAGDAQQAAEAEDLIAQIEAKKADLHNAVYKYIPEHAVQLGGGSSGLPGGGGFGKNMIPLGGGKFLQAPDSETAKKAIEKAQMAEAIKGNIAKARQLYNDVKSGKIRPDEYYRDREALKADSMQKFTTLQGGGVLTGEEGPNALRAMGFLTGPINYLTGDEGSTLAKGAARIDELRDKQLAAIGGRQFVSTGPALNKKSNEWEETYVPLDATYDGKAAPSKTTFSTAKGLGEK